MRTKFSIIALVFLSLACTFEGVKSNDVQPQIEDSLANVHAVDSAYKHMEDQLIPELAEDTLKNGQKNQMVWMNNQGLRIEWRSKSPQSNRIRKNDVVMVNYEARVARGEIYDSNIDIGYPVPLKTGMGQLIEGWETALLQMGVGDEGRIMIPSKLAYGENGYLGKIPQNADIIIEIEIVEKITPTTLDEGVKVYVYEHGDSLQPTPTKNQKITFDYFAYHKNGKGGIYDNSFAKGNPFTVSFMNDNVVDGLHQGLSILKQGDKAFIDIPSKLAYGKRGMLDLVPANTDIVYDIRIQSIK